MRVDVHDFPDPGVGKAIPYGVYDVGANEGFVNVGDDADTAEFAVATIGRWWDEVGSAAYPDAARLMITADAGGSNGYRNRLWKVKLGELAARTGLRSPCATSRPDLQVEQGRAPAVLGHLHELADLLDHLIGDLADSSVPELRGVPRTLRRSRTQILAWHTTGASNGPPKR